MLLYRFLMAMLIWPAGLLLRRHPNFAGTIAQRLGLSLPDPGGAGPVVWVHAASVGEVKAAAGLMKALKEAYPEARICLSAMTATGRQVAGTVPGVDLVFPLPFDAAWVMRRYFNHLRPKVLVIVETELWPCMISEAARLGIPVVIVNGRMTERSAGRYAILPGLSRAILSHVHVLAMAEQDAARFSRLGAGEVKTLGNLKLDSIADVNPAKRGELRDFLGIGDRPVFIAGSIREGEEEAVMEAVKAAHGKVAGLFSILAPRHPGQIGALAELARQSGLEWCLKSRFEYGTDLVLVDTMGELFSLYGASDAAFVGGSLVDSGGQNILEPIAWGVPTVHGPHMDNFTWAVEVVEGCTIRVHSPSELSGAIVDIVTRPEKYHDLARQARSRLAEQRGVTLRYLEGLREYLS
jgi:3-deoxy-D-manno-octulosonic-acid transferase